jgi:hypothetical protein
MDLEPTHFRARNKSITSIIENRFEDRMTFKKALRELADSSRAPNQFSCYKSNVTP